MIRITTEGLQRRFARWATGGGLRVQLARSSAGSLMIKVAHSGLAFGLAIVLARTLGPEGYGAYSYALAILMLVAMPAQIGVPQLVTRETTKGQVRKNWPLVAGIWRWGNVAVLGTSVLSALALATITLSLTSTSGEASLRSATLIAGLGLIPLVALANVRGACLRGLGLVVLGQLPETVLRPGILLLSILFCTAIVSLSGDLSAKMAMRLHVSAAFLTLLVSILILFVVRPDGIRTKPKPVYEHVQWIQSIIPLSMITGFQILNNYADILILGIYRPNDQVGIYRAVFEVSLLVVFALKAMNMVVQPYFAKLYAQDQKKNLETLFLTSARITLVFALPPTVLFMFYGEEVLTLIFGEPFRLGAIALLILAIGQLVNAGMGSVGMLLNMTGNERTTMNAVIIAASSNVILNFLLIPDYGMEGAATASTVALIVWNVILRNAIRKKLAFKKYF